MKKTLCFSFSIPLLFLCLVLSTEARADFWGGDIPLLAEIVTNTAAQLTQLKSILGTSTDTLGLLRDVNKGIHDAMNIIETRNRTMSPGVLGDIQNSREAYSTVQGIYGGVPRSPDARVQELNDQSVAEDITLHNQALQYADQIDLEAERIKDYSRNVSPAGASKLTAESLGVLIHVNDQILRTNAAMLKLLSENLALQNKREKVNSQHFLTEYEGLTSALKSTSSFKQGTNLNSISRP